MNEQTLLLRQAHPKFVKDGRLTSQAFMPFPKDDGHLSVYDGDQLTPQCAYLHYTVDLKLLSDGVWAVTCEETAEIGLSAQPDPVEGSPAHAYIDFDEQSDKENRKAAKRLRAFAVVRRRLHPA